MVLSKYHPFYSDDVPFAGLPRAVRTASPAGAVLPGWQGVLWGQSLQAPSEPGSEQEQHWGPSRPGEPGREALPRWPLRSLAGPTNIVASPAAGGRKGQSSYTVSRGSSQHSFHWFSH